MENNRKNHSSQPFTSKRFGNRNNSHNRARGERPRPSASGPDPRVQALEPADPFVFRLGYLIAANEYLPTWHEVVEYLSHLDGVKKVEGCEAKFEYCNPHTHVCATFYGYHLTSANEFGLVFQLPMPRPTCFIYELLPLAVQVAREFSFAVQALDNDKRLILTNPEVEALAVIWREANDHSRSLYEAEHGVSPSVKSADIEMAWEYLLLSDDLSYRYRHSDCEVLELEFVRRKRTGEVLRMCRWNGLKPAVFPPVDLVMLQQPTKPLRDGKIIKAQELFDSAKPWVKTTPIPIVHKIYQDAEPHEEFIEVLNNLKGTTMRSYENVALDDLADT